MKDKYKKYIEYIVSDIQPPYLKYLEQYGLKHKEYELVLSKIYNQSVTIEGNRVYDTDGKLIYGENSIGFWHKKEYDTNGKLIYGENSIGFWHKKEYDTNGNEIYYEDSDGYWVKQEYDEQGIIIYHENSDGDIEDNR